MRRAHSLLAAVIVLLTLTGCHQSDWAPDPVSRASEVTGRIWVCTPGDVGGEPGYAKSAASAVTMEIVAGVGSHGGPGNRFPPGTVLGQSIVHAGEVWPAGSVHALPVAWIQPGVTRSDLEDPTDRIRITRMPATARDADRLQRWRLSFFISLDVVTINDTGTPQIDWHLAVISTPGLTAEPNQRTVVDSAFADLRGWPSPCPHG